MSPHLCGHNASQIVIPMASNALRIKSNLLSPNYKAHCDFASEAHYAMVIWPSFSSSDTQYVPTSGTVHYLFLLLANQISL